jgi:hypothetical protein
MPLDLHLSIPDNSLAALAVQRIVSQEHVTPEQAATRILSEAAKTTPALRMIGLFADDEDAAVLDEAMLLVEEGRQTQTTRDIGL